MAKKVGGGSLTAQEKKIAKALLKKEWRGQDIQNLINTGRASTINSARIAEVKKDDTIAEASKDDVDLFIKKKESHDYKTGLNVYDHERLIRAREAMIIAVQIFNNPAIQFKTEAFAVMSNIAWTYLLHEYYERKGKNVRESDGRALLLSKMIEWQDCPLTKGMKNNIRHIMNIRNEVEHTLMNGADREYYSLFQPSCLNFNNKICELFGDKLSLANDLSFAIQFNKLSLRQIETLHQYDIPEGLRAIDANMESSLTDEEKMNTEYRFTVYYAIESASKSKAALIFVSPDTAEGKEIHNIMIKQEVLDNKYPHKPGVVCNQVSAATGIKFSQHNHTQACKLYKVRPPSCSPTPENTTKEYCIYHKAHKDYTYSDKWVEFLIDKVKDTNEFSKIKQYKG